MAIEAEEARVGPSFEGPLRDEALGEVVVEIGGSEAHEILASTWPNDET